MGCEVVVATAPVCFGCRVGGGGWDAGVEFAWCEVADAGGGRDGRIAIGMDSESEQSPGFLRTWGLGGCVFVLQLSIISETSAYTSE
jgi:hypothetical protein